MNPALVVENLSSVYHPTVNPIDGKLDVSYTIRNAGNVRLGAHQHIALKNVFGMSLKERTAARPSRAAPRQPRDVPRRVHERPRLGRLSTKSRSTLLNQADLKHVKASTSATSHAWAMPWTLLALIAIVIAIWRLYVRRRRQRGGGKPPGGGGPPPGGAAAAPDDAPARAQPGAGPTARRPRSGLPSGHAGARVMGPRVAPAPPELNPARRPGPPAPAAIRIREWRCRMRGAGIAAMAVTVALLASGVFDGAPRRPPTPRPTLSVGPDAAAPGDLVTVEPRVGRRGRPTVAVCGNSGTHAVPRTAT